MGITVIEQNIESRFKSLQEKEKVRKERLVEADRLRTITLSQCAMHAAHLMAARSIELDFPEASIRWLASHLTVISESNAWHPYNPLELANNNTPIEEARRTVFMPFDFSMRLRVKNALDIVARFMIYRDADGTPVGYTLDNRIVHIEQPFAVIHANGEEEYFGDIIDAIAYAKLHYANEMSTLWISASAPKKSNGTVPIGI